MRDVNKVILLGRLGSDPVQRFTKSGASVVNFSLATTKRTPQENAASPGEVTFTEETQWHKVVVWGKQGEACAQYLKKGSSVYVEGSIRSQTYEDKEGLKKMSFEIQSDVVSFLSSPRAGTQTENKEFDPGSDLPM